MITESRHPKDSCYIYGGYVSTEFFADCTVDGLNFFMALGPNKDWIFEKPVEVTTCARVYDDIGREFTEIRKFFMV